MIPEVKYLFVMSGYFGDAPGPLKFSKSHFGGTQVSHYRYCGNFEHTLKRLLGNRGSFSCTLNVTCGSCGETLGYSRVTFEDILIVHSFTAINCLPTNP